MSEVSKLVGYAVKDIPEAALVSKLTAYAVKDIDHAQVYVSKLTAYAVKDVAAALEIKVGNVIGMQNDAWGGTPTSFSYRWFRHANAADLTGVAIAGATGATYPVAPEDEGLYLSGEKTPINASGTGVPVRSNIVGAILPADASTLPLLIEAGEIYEIGALSISGSPVLTATEGAAYTGFTVTAADGPEPWVFSLVGTWPAGITIDSVSGAVSGTPTVSGTFAGLSVRVTDAAGQTADLATFSIEVATAVVFDMLTLTSLNRWYDPSDATTVTKVAANVSQLNDKSGNAYHLTQSDSARRPPESTINSLSVLLTDGVNDHMVSDSGMSHFAGTDAAHSLVMVIEPRVDFVTNGMPVTFNTTTTASEYHSLQLPGTGGFKFVKRDVGAATTVTDTGGTATINTVYIVTWIHSGTNTIIRVNGTEVLNVACDVGAMTGINRFTLGAWLKGTTLSSPFKGAIGETALATAVWTAQEIADVEAHLANKWGITL